ncbi:hypothetical protein [Enterococcus hirae]|uniref:hypothetical protein n=1 Tax=Enterococcus hirae TaxID=1354 RepID=UPI00109495AE|nr:hypothetical protein [Enterococcus hirae]MCR1913578.1 hypothetical protein [Enterococcus hirae]MDL4889314.1 hypothetical protein [Enterococcus hirae]MDL4891892.1 hypothetical protein [Enterococcus hirae]MDL4898029.1 hypothetical protein [Enterococcus hirae]MDL4900661.1 hypothetical protein [Enterococcus hirae]
MYADKEKIEKLLFNTDITTYEISRQSSVAASTISDLRKKKTSIEKMRFDNASKLTKYAESILS